jgi:hypothetical protein
MDKSQVDEMVFCAKATLRVANDEGWAANDGTRNLAELALVAAKELERVHELLEAEQRARWAAEQDAQHWREIAEEGEP